ncbi:transcriptional activator of glycolytic enzymes-domain-containing protein [Achaetomium macrosporum]|uniref:Transcriptional activator of glycolytic enzymes-domain-containing protein n=1 Tax=Achaetomium macrosporum TaxID=79813 RepID=A0AAN7H5N1_9PEZI|nr:transcriptional activator of glycolytic enzymes-domain-containing protein [Achaetomium macrosporum]
MAGHPAQMGCFEIRRARISPPDSLLPLIWPDLNKWTGRLGPEPGQVNDLAAAGFTGLLFYPREVILQDSVFLMRRFPESVSAGHMLTQALPVLTDCLKTAEARREAQIWELSTALMAEIRTAKEQLAGAYQSSLQTFLAESLFQLKPASTPMPAPAPAPVSTPLIPLPRSLGELVAEGSLRGPAPLSVSRSISPGIAGSAEDHGLEAEAEADPPRHRMSRAVKTVRDLWREWTVGLQGGPSILALDNRWGSRWRASRQAEVQWY